MADTMLGGVDINFTNSRKAVADQGGQGSNLGNVSNYVSVQAMRSALSTANGTYYTTARLDSLTVNDMIFALRNMQDATTIASYMTNSAA